MEKSEQDATRRVCDARGPAELSTIAQAASASFDWRDWLPPAPSPTSSPAPPIVREDSSPVRWPNIRLYDQPIPQRPNLARMYRDNQARVRAQLAKFDLAGVVLYDSRNIRYVTGTRNMSLWTLHNAVRYAFLPTEGPLVLFDFHNCEHLSEGLDTVQEVHHAKSWSYVEAGSLVNIVVEKWAQEIADLLKSHGGGNRRLAFDQLDPAGAFALTQHGVEIHDGQEVLESCRARKSPDELAAIRRAVEVCEAGLAALQGAIEPGVTENQIWAKLHEVNIANNGEWIETRLLTSGPRTNPWFQESSDRRLEAGDIVSLDTDLIGPYGMCVDMSRSFLCPGTPANEEQRTAHGLALEQIRHNTELLRPGVSAIEIGERGFQLPEAYLPNRYSAVLHGVGMADEWPRIAYNEDNVDGIPEVILEEGMTLCVESYTGKAGGSVGVKLEEQVLISANGPILLTSYPYAEELLGTPWI
ncbi:MAG: Xaa-Pro peptidase family protein [Alphaproteobacteria bacterium]